MISLSSSIVWPTVARPRWMMTRTPAPSACFGHCRGSESSHSFEKGELCHEALSQKPKIAQSCSNGSPCASAVLNQAGEAAESNWCFKAHCQSRTKLHWWHYNFELNFAKLNFAFQLKKVWSISSVLHSMLLFNSASGGWGLWEKVARLKENIEGLQPTIQKLENNLNSSREGHRRLSLGEMEENYLEARHDHYSPLVIDNKKAPSDLSSSHWETLECPVFTLDSPWMETANMPLLQAEWWPCGNTRVVKLHWVMSHPRTTVHNEQLQHRFQGSRVQHNQHQRRRCQSRHHCTPMRHRYRRSSCPCHLCAKKRPLGAFVVEWPDLGYWLWQVCPGCGWLGKACLM